MCRNPRLQRERGQRREALLQATEAALAEIGQDYPISATDQKKKCSRCEGRAPFRLRNGLEPSP